MPKDEKKKEGKDSPRKKETKKEAKEPKEKKTGIKKLGLKSFLSKTLTLTSPRGSPTRSSVLTPPQCNMDLSVANKDTIRCVTRLQAHVRGYLTRKAIQIQGTKEQQQLQYKAMRALVRVEQKYVGLLSILVNEYALPCKEICKGNKKRMKTYPNVFIDVEKVFEHHKQFLAQIERYLEVWPRCQNIGKTIIQKILEFSFYENYVDRIPGSKNQLKLLEKEKSPVFTYITQKNAQRKKDWNDPNHVYRDFRTLLKLPLKQLTAYKYPLKKFMTSTPEAHRDYRFRVAAAATFREIGLYINYIFVEALAKRDMVILEGRLITPKDKFSVMATHRKIIRQGELQVNGKGGRRVILFSDVAVISKVQNAVTYTYEDHFDLKGATMRRLSTSSDGLKQIFTVKALDGRDYTFATVSLGKSKSWQKSFEDALSRRNDTVFGLAPAEAAERDNAPLPKILLSIGYRLNRGLTQDRVFRAAGDPSALRSLKRRFNHHIRDINLTNNSAQDVAALLVPYLESLSSQPVFEMDYHNKIIYNKEFPAKEAVADFFRTSVDQLPKVNQNLFEYLVFLLHRAATISKNEGSLTTIELAVLFAPLLFKSTKWNLNYCYKMPRIATVFELVLREPQMIFPIDQTVPVPNTIRDFLLSDYFGPHWRKFRAEDDKLFAFLTKPDIIRALIQTLIITSNPKSFEGESQMQQAVLAILVLTCDRLMPIIVQSEAYLTQLFGILEGQNTQWIQETFHFFRDTVECLLEAQPKEMTEYLQAHPNVIQLTIAHIHDGSILSLLLTIASYSQKYAYPKYHRVLSLWATEALNVFISVDNLNSYLMEFLYNFLSEVFKDSDLVRSVTAQGLISLISNDKTMNALFHRGTSSDDQDIAVYSVSFLRFLICKVAKNVEEEDDDEDEEGEGEGEGEQEDTDSSAQSESSQSESGSSEFSSNNSESATKPKKNIVVVQEYPFPSLVARVVALQEVYFSHIMQILLQSVQQRTFGVHRISLLEFVGAAVTTGLLSENVLTADFFQFLINQIFDRPTNNILHVAIIAIFFNVCENYQNKQTVFKAILDAKVPHKAAAEVQSQSYLSSCAIGHLFSLVEIFENCPALKTNSVDKWSGAVAALKAHKAKTAPDEVKRRRRNLATDRYEDRI